MPDPMTDDETIRAAFTELLYDEPPHFAPPGVDAARRTNRRRQLTATATTAGLAGVALLGTGYLAVGGLTEPDPTGSTPPATPTESPILTEPITTQEQARLNDLVHEALGWPESPPRIVRLPDGYMGGSGYGAGSFVGETDQDRIDDIERARSSPVSWESLRPGSYTVRLACAAVRGSIRIVVEIGASQVTGTAQCGDTGEQIEGGLAEVAFTIRDPDEDPAISLDVDLAAITTLPDLSFGYGIFRE